MGHVANMNESCHAYLSLHTQQVAFQLKILRWLPIALFQQHLWTSHVTYVNESWHTYEWVMSHIWMSHVTHMNESCHIYGWVMSHIWMSHVAHLNESYHIFEYVMPHLWMRHATHMKESHKLPVARFQQHTWMSHVTHTHDMIAPHSANPMPKSRHTYARVMSHIRMTNSKSRGNCR